MASKILRAHFVYTIILSAPFCLKSWIRHWGKVVGFVVVVIVHTKLTSSQLLGILASGQHCHNVENGSDESLLQSA